MRKFIYSLEGLEKAEEVETSARSQLYLLFSDSFHVPDEEFYTDVRSGTLKGWVRDAMERLPYKLDFMDSVEQLDAQVGYEEFNSEFMRLFEVRPVCSLNESQHRGSHTTVLEDLVRFYNFFDLSAAGARELPDHLRIELDFMHFLTFKEAEKLHSGMDSGSFVRAESDFLQRHLVEWVPLVHQKVDQFAQLDFFKVLTRLLERFISCECELLKDRAASSA